MSKQEEIHLGESTPSNLEDSDEEDHEEDENQEKIVNMCFMAIENEVILHTDHVAWKYLFTEKNAKPCLIHWILRLQEFDSDIHDKKGSKNVVADHLSSFKLIISRQTVEEKLEVYASRLFEKNQASIEFNAHSADPPQSNPTSVFDGTSTSRGLTGDEENKQDYCNLNKVVMDRIAKIESKQSEIEARQAEILSFQRDLKSHPNDLSGNDEFENNDFNNYTKFETDVQVEDNDGSQLKDFEVESQVLYDRKGKAVVCDKTNNESIHHGATEFKKIEEDDDIIQIDDITPSAPMRRTRKIAAVYGSPYISDFESSGKNKAVIREIRSGTSALKR
ncbi:RNA-directed DNA polymerase [Abeliophyllum distichum]|uniref:RNA-directed DNA polymerase n=1 Tax=Abeliophyllum distichum TaxID=126358 RepID=A0ABD1PF97_9LAMI